MRTIKLLSVALVTWAACVTWSAKAQHMVNPERVDYFTFGGQPVVFNSYRKNIHPGRVYEVQVTRDAGRSWQLTRLDPVLSGGLFSVVTGPGRAVYRVVDRTGWPATPGRPLTNGLWQFLMPIGQHAVSPTAWFRFVEEVPTDFTDYPTGIRRYLAPQRWKDILLVKQDGVPARWITYPVFSYAPLPIVAGEYYVGSGVIPNLTVERWRFQ